MPSSPYSHLSPEDELLLRLAEQCAYAPPEVILRAAVQLIKNVVVQDMPFDREQTFHNVHQWLDMAFAELERVPPGPTPPPIERSN